MSIRVYTLAKELGLASKDLVELLKMAGLEVTSHMSSITEEEKDQFLQSLNASKKDSQKEGPAPLKDPAKEEKENKEPAPSPKAEKKKPGAPAQKKKPEDKKAPLSHEKKQAEKDILEGEKDKEEKESPSKNRKRQDKKKKQDKKKEVRGKDKKSRSQRRRERVAKEEQAREDDSIVVLQVPITVKEFAEELHVSVAQVIKKLIELGIMASQNESIDEDVALLLAEEFGKEVEFGLPESDQSVEEIFNLDPEDDEASLEGRSPVITVMGHVDHGKTSLLDVIKRSHVTDSEAGGITQHIGAYVVDFEDKKLTFLDTPGHEAFTSMRSRGAQITDIAILVVAADDGVMPQTIEAINHAKVAEVPIIVAINKIDREGANVDRVKQELTEQGLVPEDWGGDTIMVPVSAKTEEGIDELLEMTLLVAEMLELKANPHRLAVGTVVEARLDKGKGPMATILIQKGTLKFGQYLVSGVSYGHIRAMTNDKKKNVGQAGPSTPVVVQGLSGVPNAGDAIYAVEDEKVAKEVAQRNLADLREEKLASTNKVSLENLFAKIQEGELKDLNIIIKADVKGTVEAISQSLEKLSNEEVKINIIHSGVGGITESDVTLASASNALVIGFNVRPNIMALDLAKQEEIDVRTYRVIYDIIEDMKAAVAGLLDPDIVEEVQGRCEVRETFKLPNKNIVAGIYVLKGKIIRSGYVKVLRDDVIIHDGPIGSLQRFQDDAKEIAAGYEGGMLIEGFNDIQVGDVFECYIEKEVKKEI